MKLTYETGTATLIQFITLSLLNILTGLDSVFAGCRKQDSDCLGNFLISFIFYILVVLWFGAVCVLGYAAQQRRSAFLARCLIVAEAMIAFVALVNIKLNLTQHGFLSLLTSILDLILSIWIIVLAWRLLKSGGGRVVVKHRARQRRRPS